jgi:hypothetical protein
VVGYLDRTVLKVSAECAILAPTSVQIVKARWHLTSRGIWNGNSEPRENNYRARRGEREILDQLRAVRLKPLYGERLYWRTPFFITYLGTLPRFSPAKTWQDRSGSDATGAKIVSTVDQTTDVPSLLPLGALMHPYSHLFAAVSIELQSLHLE